MAMEQPPIMVCSFDGRHTWHADKDVIAQMSVLQNQMEDMRADRVLLPPAISPGHFTDILPLIDSDKKAVKIMLRAKNSQEIAQIARDADCVGAQQLLERSLRMLEKRVGDGQAVDLPETLQQQLVAQIVRCNPNIRSLLFKTIEHMDPVAQTQEVRVCHIRQDAIQIDANENLQTVNLNGYVFMPDAENSHIIHSSRGKKALIFNQSKVLLLDPEEQSAICHWHLLSTPAVLLPHDQGFFCIASGPYDSTKYITHYRLHGDPIRFIPFESWSPTAMALSYDGSKLVVGSDAGSVSIFDAQTGAVDNQLPTPLPNRSNSDLIRDCITALAIDRNSQYIAVSKGHRLMPHSRIELWNVKKLTHTQLDSLYTSFIEDLCFDETGSFLYVLEFAFMSIWVTKSNTMLHKIKTTTFDGPYSAKLNSLLVDDAGTACTIYGLCADRIFTQPLVDKNTMHELAQCPIPVIAFLARANKKIDQGKQITHADEPDLKILYRSLPRVLQRVIAKHMGWKDWLRS